jgi:uncharacterized membrane protein
MSKLLTFLLRLECIALAILCAWCVCIFFGTGDLVALFVAVLMGFGAAGTYRG